jgi:hypothetical protein
MTSPSRVLLLLPLLLLLASGCSHSRTPSKVSGKVTYKGQPVPGGTVSFHRQGEDKSGVYTFVLSSEGTYTGTDLPAEEMLVTIETESVNPKQATSTYGPAGQGGKGGMSADDMRKKMMERGAVPKTAEKSGQYVEIPKKYGDKTSSPLKKTLTSGTNEFNFDLTD